MRNKKGFTLIELLIVFAIIGVFAASGFALLNPALQLRRARDATRKTDLGKMQVVLELYRADVGSYPASPLPSCGTALSVGTAPNVTTYINAIPCDPKSTSPYTYASPGLRVSYTLTACLENINDLQKDSTSVAPCDTSNDITTSTNWSYTVTNQ